MKDEFTPEPGETPRGYLSAESKKKFTITAGILGALFFIAQFVAPFIFMLAIIPFTFFGDTSFMKRADPEKGTCWKGAVWYVETPVSTEPSSESRSMLKRIDLRDDKGPVDVTALFMENPWLLGDNGRLWVISSSSVGYYKDGEIVILSDKKVLGDISRPFLFKGRPAVIEERPGNLFLRVLESGGDWQVMAKFSLGMREGRCCIYRNLQVVSQGEKLYMFLRHGNTLFFREGLPVEGRDTHDSWLSVSDVDYSWRALLLDNEPVVFMTKTGEQFPNLVGLKRNGSAWEPFFTYKKGLTFDMGVYKRPEKAGFLLLIQSFPGAVRMVYANRDGVEKEAKFGKGFPFSAWFMPIMFIPHAGMFIMPIILAVILSALMKRHRVSEHKGGDKVLPMASLTRRAFAQLFDIIVVFSPAILIALVYYFPNFDMEDIFLSSNSPFFMIFGFILGGLSWVIICLLAYSVMEGKWGGTPGKWIMGIRVFDMDLQPCGFGRAIVRNLLKFIDGFFNFMVGIMVVALSENWQRVGDMAARTIVVQTRGHSY